MLGTTFAGAGIDSRNCHHLRLIRKSPLSLLRVEGFEGAQDARNMVVTPDYVDELIGVVCSHGEVLPWHEHLRRVHHFALVVDEEAAVARQGRLSFEPTYKQELVVGDVDRLEVVGDVVDRVILIILELQLFEFSGPFNVVERT